MKAAVYRKAHAGKVLEIRDLDQPLPKDNEVLLRVRAPSVNPLDWRMKSERPGVDVAGEIVAVGKHVTQFKPGHAALGVGKGAFAEYACARACKLALKPEGVSYEQAAAVPIAGMTALQALRDVARLQPGQKVLINGAAGGIGTFAVQIAKSFGAHVTGVCSTKNVELVRSLGTDRVIDYTREDFTRDSERYDLLLDNVANRTLPAVKSVLRPNGTCVIAGGAEENVCSVYLVAQNIRAVGVVTTKLQILHGEYQSRRPDNVWSIDHGWKSNPGDRSTLRFERNGRRHGLCRSGARPGKGRHHTRIVVGGGCRFSPGVSRPVFCWVGRKRGCVRLSRGVCFRVPGDLSGHSKIQGGEYVYGPETATSLG
jgi:NADPH:quinone reductase-like Zn-dependent oxidoreductase